MYYIGPDSKVYDDGLGSSSKPYGVDELGRRYELDQATETRLSQWFRSNESSRLPLGNYVSRATKAMGMQPCQPCAARQAALNELGDRVARTLFWWER